MEVHIGNEIRRVLEEKGITGAWLAERIKTSQRNLYSLLNRQEISTKQLEKISKSLEYDFFQLYTKKINVSAVSVVNEPEQQYQKSMKRKLPVIVELDGSEENLKYWTKRLSDLNKMI